MKTKTIGVAGLGLLGRGIAACLLGHGFRVIAFTRRKATHDAARTYIDQAIHDLVDRGGFPSTLKNAWPDHFQPVESVGALGPCEFVIESVIEDLAAKQETFDTLEAEISRDTPIASNTSAMPITLLQSGRKYPERFLGMHWAEPAHVTRFLELIRGEKTSDSAMKAAMTLALAVGKDPSIVNKDVPGFIVNRIGYAMYREALNILESGIADVETIDRSCRNAVGLWATMCGPFRWIDLTGGPALYAKAMAGVLPTLCNATDTSPTMTTLAQSEARGIENGHGFFEYTEDEAQAWEARYREHAWRVRQLVDLYFPQGDA